MSEVQLTRELFTGDEHQEDVRAETETVVARCRERALKYPGTPVATYPGSMVASLSSEGKDALACGWVSLAKSLFEAAAGVLRKNREQLNPEELKELPKRLERIEWTRDILVKGVPWGGESDRSFYQRLTPGQKRCLGLVISKILDNLYYLENLRQGSDVRGLSLSLSTWHLNLMGEIAKNDFTATRAGIEGGSIKIDVPPELSQRAGRFFQHWRDAKEEGTFDEHDLALVEEMNQVETDFYLFLRQYLLGVAEGKITPQPAPPLFP